MHSCVRVNSVTQVNEAAGTDRGTAILLLSENTSNNAFKALKAFQWVIQVNVAFRGNSKNMTEGLYLKSL